jgi:hypothetical protein
MVVVAENCQPEYQHNYKRYHDEFARPIHDFTERVGQECLTHTVLLLSSGEAQA